MNAADRVCAEVREAFEQGTLDDWHAEHLPACAACEAALGPGLRVASPAGQPSPDAAARLDAQLDALCAPASVTSPTAAPTPLPWAWIAALTVGMAAAVLGGLRHPHPRADVRDPWRARPTQALSPAELPLESIGDPRSVIRGVSE